MQVKVGWEFMHEIDLIVWKCCPVCELKKKHSDIKVQQSNINQKKYVGCKSLFENNVYTFYIIFILSFSELLTCKEDKSANNGNKTFLQVLL